jgi:pimeloyl-ACP methyl ester carboxylesterase
MDFQEQTFFTGDAAINYVEGPAAGPALVLLHGGSARWQSWESILPQLTRRWHVFAPDLRGHGKSDRTPQYRLQDFAADTAAFLGGVVNEPAFLFGHSLGGMVALYTAAQYPDGIRAVLVGDAPLNRDTFRATIEGSRERLASWAEIAGGQIPLTEVIAHLKDAPIETPGNNSPNTMRQVWGEENPVFPWLGENLFHNDPAMLHALLEDLEAVTAGYHMNTLLPQVRCPVLLLQGDPNAGGVMTDIEIARAVQLLPYPTVVRLDGVSHVFHNEAPQKVLDAVEPFLGHQTTNYRVS